MSQTIFDQLLSDAACVTGTVSKADADELFSFFRNCSLFRWKDANNDCEDRANAACMLLDKWRIPNVKAWVFSGQFFRRDSGCLVNSWNYHVAAALPVNENGETSFYVIDPATLPVLDTIAHWADGVTASANSYHLVKTGDNYIFNPFNFGAEAWHKRNMQNYKWTMQGLAGINGVTRTGKAQLVFNKPRIRQTERLFKELLKNKPSLL